MKSFSLQLPSGTTDVVILNLYDVSQMTGVENYSDLDYEQMNLLVGGTYAFTPAFYMTAEAEYAEFTDNEVYVYGDQSGEYYRGNLGVGYRF